MEPPIVKTAIGRDVIEVPIKLPLKLLRSLAGIKDIYLLAKAPSRVISSRIWIKKEFLNLLNWNSSPIS